MTTKSTAKKKTDKPKRGVPATKHELEVKTGRLERKMKKANKSFDRRLRSVQSKQDMVWVETQTPTLEKPSPSDLPVEERPETDDVEPEAKPDEPDDKKSGGSNYLVIALLIILFIILLGMTFVFGLAFGLNLGGSTDGADTGDQSDAPNLGEQDEMQNHGWPIEGEAWIRMQGVSTNAPCRMTTLDVPEGATRVTFTFAGTPVNLDGQSGVGIGLLEASVVDPNGRTVPLSSWSDLGTFKEAEVNSPASGNWSVVIKAVAPLVLDQNVLLGFSLDGTGEITRSTGFTDATQC